MLMKKYFILFIMAAVTSLVGAQTSILGLNFGSDYDVVYSQLADRFGSASVTKLDGEHIQVKDFDYTIEDVKVNNITCTFSYIDGEHHLCSIAFTSEPYVLSYESDKSKINDFNGYAVRVSNKIAVELNKKYKVSGVEKRINTAKPWTTLYRFSVDENVTGVIAAYFNATKKLMLQNGTSFARLTYTDSRYVKNKIDEL